jgi:hypothetical protein
MTAVPLAPAHRPGSSRAPTSRTTSQQVTIQGRDKGAARSPQRTGDPLRANLPPTRIKPRGADSEVQQHGKHPGGRDAEG